jgi:hypothetical protein
MIDPKEPLSLSQLVESYSSPPEHSNNTHLLQLIFTHDELIPNIKNQSQILKKM